MTSKDHAREQVAQIVNRFRAEPASKRRSYNEQETRVYYILPLFRALGWNTENPAEMSAEEQISRGFVDFGFYLDGVPRFYVETKRIPENINKPEWARQAINYSWLKGVTWAVLTDFEGLKVFNAEVNTRDPQKAVFLDLHWESYANGAFEDLWLLSKEAVRSGQIDTLAERYGKKARKGAVNELLLAQLTQWRRDLFRQIQQWGDTLWSQNPREIDNAVQRLIDRLIFIRTVEDRGVEAPRLQAVVRQFEARTGSDKNLLADLQALFRELDG
ncbi:MAG: hypothetical protein JXA10_12400, partial [Anaerolineae bacterium]|nr:hypothetical protein [Anaerolineae bacterium]